MPTRSREGALHGAYGLALHVKQDVRVGVHRLGDAGVSQEFLDNLGVDITPHRSECLESGYRHPARLEQPAGHHHHCRSDEAPTLYTFSSGIRCPMVLTMETDYFVRFLAVLGLIVVGARPLWILWGP